ncbi:MAG TPA: di-heme oxidoredictase family protein [Methylomirabilota bacterium]|jgi:CxxC motif-containing protein (DUF1111 family)|nr:di-heme oxidoredictase family protein [Methylomirabilota bacterium]
MRRSPRLLLLVVCLLITSPATPKADFVASDPGIRGGPPAAGGPLSGLSQLNQQLFLAGQEAIQEIDSVLGTIPGTGRGLGPRFNMDGCGGCHAHPAPGGSSPPVNPQIAVATKEGATNVVPFFVTLDGPIRHAHVLRQSDGPADGSIAHLYTITGRTDAAGCVLGQPDFDALAAADNLAFHVPLPLFGRGLMEAIGDSTILDNQAADSAQKQALGIGGRAGGTDVEVGRFGWKAQGRSLPSIVGGAYAGEVGVTNLFVKKENDQTPGCQFNSIPEDRGKPHASNPIARLPDTLTITFFVRFLAPPTPAPDTPSSAQGRTLFTQIGCALCHTPALQTAASTNPALNKKTASLYSDLLLHRMGPGLADGLVNGNAGPDELRTAPLWGLGQRIFFLHDGRTTNLLAAIGAHASDADASYPASEANAVISQFNALTEQQKQNLLDFLRSL